MKIQTRVCEQKIKRPSKYAIYCGKELPVSFFRNRSGRTVNQCKDCENKADRLRSMDKREAEKGQPKKGRDKHKAGFGFTQYMQETESDMFQRRMCLSCDRPPEACEQGGRGGCALYHRGFKRFQELYIFLSEPRTDKEIKKELGNWQDELAYLVRRKDHGKPLIEKVDGKWRQTKEDLQSFGKERYDRYGELL